MQGKDVASTDNDTCVAENESHADEKSGSTDGVVPVNLDEHANMDVDKPGMMPEKQPAQGK